MGEWTEMKATINNDEITSAVAKLFEARQSSNAVQQRIDTTRKREQKINENQERIRNNIKSMEKVQSSGDLLKRYMQDFERDEDDLKTIASELEGFEIEKSTILGQVKQQERIILAIAKKERERLEAS